MRISHAFDLIIDWQKKAQHIQPNKKKRIKSGRVLKASANHMQNYEKRAPDKRSQRRWPDG